MGVMMAPVDGSGSTPACTAFVPNFIGIDQLVLLVAAKIRQMVVSHGVCKRYFVSS